MKPFYTSNEAAKKKFEKRGWKAQTKWGDTHGWYGIIGWTMYPPVKQSWKKGGR